jgi:EAL domain-containing protein (putative c-di-GMP-specific phosphodiesterase class I)
VNRQSLWGKALSLTIVAKGVETTEQEALLRDHDCDEMQDFLFWPSVCRKHPALSAFPRSLPHIFNFKVRIHRDDEIAHIERII